MKVCGIEYQADKPASVKKLAKTEAALAALIALKLMTKEESDSWANHA